MAQRPIKVIIHKQVAKGLTRAVAANGVRYAAVQAENELIDILSVPPKRTGRIYPRGLNRKHQASAPTGGEQGQGEAPAVDSGELRQSVVSYTEEIGDTFRAVVGTPLKRAALLEFGTDKMAPRPFISLLNNEKRWARILKAFRIGVRTQYQRAAKG